MTKFISEPGKFENEPEYVRDLWTAALDGQAVEVHEMGGVVVYVFYNDGSMEDLAAGTVTVLWESETGFIHHDNFDSKEDWISRRDHT